MPTPPFSLHQAVEAFYLVRDFPYAIDAAHDADGLLQLQAGDCQAKADLLHRLLTNLGLPSRLVRMRYLLPVVIPLVDTLPSRVDLHRAVQIQINDQWLLVDATHDAPLGRGGLTVAQWDGLTPTPPAYDQVGPILVEGAHDADIGIVLAEIAAWTESCDFQLLRDWQDAYIDWLTAIRGTDSLEST